MGGTFGMVPVWFGVVSTLLWGLESWAGWVSESAHYWVLGAQAAAVWWCSGFLTHGHETCCLWWWDRPYVENYTVDASIFESDLRVWFMNVV